jgi:type I restriction enzyme S subunit
LIDHAEANKLENRTLAATRDLLLPKLMSGEVRVKDAERLVGSTI